MLKLTPLDDGNKDRNGRPLYSMVLVQTQHPLTETWAAVYIDLFSPSEHKEDLLNTYGTVHERLRNGETVYVDLVLK